MATVTALATPSAADAPVPGYFQRRWPVWLILGSFFALTIPLVALNAHDDRPFDRWSLALFFVFALGMTHFLITFVLYFQAANRRFFWSTRSNRVAYILLPVLIFVVFDLYHALEVAALAPLLDLGLRSVIRLIDFQHFTRQCFGVMQLFRMRSGVAFPGWMKDAENHLFTATAVVLFMTFLSRGHFRPDRVAPWVGVAVVAVLCVRVLAGYVWAWRRSAARPRLAPPLAYLWLQLGSAALAVYDTRLYAFGLAMHYVEYHVLMVPRCFHVPVEPGSPTDALLAWFRTRRWLFYGVLLLLALPVTRYAWLGMASMGWGTRADGALSSRLLIALFDGLFVFHYLIEAKVWRFADPYYRRSLLPLYFQGAPAAQIATEDESAGHRRPLADPGPARLAAR